MRHAYDAEPLEAILKDELGADTTFGSDRLRTLLLVVLRNATTDSPWPLSNNPGRTFNDRALPGCNLDLPLWQLVRASTAAPTYFAPERITLGATEFVFVDGGVTPFNNPALQLVPMATLEAYGLGWPTGEDELLLVSVGTGNSEFARPDLEPDDMHLLYHATSMPGALMISAAAQQDLLCRALGRVPVGAAHRPRGRRPPRGAPRAVEPRSSPTCATTSRSARLPWRTSASTPSGSATSWPSTRWTTCRRCGRSATPSPSAASTSTTWRASSEAEAYPA